MHNVYIIVNTSIFISKFNSTSSAISFMKVVLGKLILFALIFPGSYKHVK